MTEDEIKLVKIVETTAPPVVKLVKPATDIVLQAPNAQGPAGTVVETFETVSKNLKGIAFTLTYSGGVIVSMAYANGIIKTFNRTGSKITSIVLSGATPGGIALTKTLGYTGNNLTSVGYS